MRVHHYTLGLVMLSLGAVGAWHARADQDSGSKTESRQDKADLIRHGAYLVNSASMCGDCHTPRNDGGQPDRTQLLQGEMVSIRPMKEQPHWADMAPDITENGLAGDWKEETMIKFLTTGNDPDGKKADPPMPAFRFNARDARAITLYLKSLGAPKDEK